MNISVHPQEVDGVHQGRAEGAGHMNQGVHYYKSLVEDAAKYSDYEPWDIALVDYISPDSDWQTYHFAPG